MKQGIVYFASLAAPDLNLHVGMSLNYNWFSPISKVTVPINTIDTPRAFIEEAFLAVIHVEAAVLQAQAAAGSGEQFANLHVSLAMHLKILKSVAMPLMHALGVLESAFDFS
jgi:hypothetical protein